MLRSQTSMNLVARRKPNWYHARRFSVTNLKIERHKMTAEQLVKNIKFVELVEKYPCLYNNQLSTYLRRDLTEQAWTEIGQKMNMSASASKEKWRNLRLVYMRHIKTKFRRPYYLADSLKFLNCYVTEPKTKAESSHLEETIDTNEENDEDMGEDAGNFSNFSYIQDMNPEESNEEKNEVNYVERDKKLLNESYHVGMDKTNRHFQESYNMDNSFREGFVRENPNRQFLLSLLPELDEMNSSQVKKFKRRVLQLIDDITTNTEQNESNQTLAEVKEEICDPL